MFLDVGHGFDEDGVELGLLDCVVEEGDQILEVVLEGLAVGGALAFLGQQMQFVLEDYLHTSLYAVVLVQDWLGLFVAIVFYLLCHDAQD